MIGRTLAHYRIIEKIGAGGMGEVYRAHDEQLDRDVALKVLPTGTLADEATRKQFRKEALALAKLNHPNVATVHDFGSQEAIDFLVMELIPGSSLAEKLKHGPLPENEIRRLGVQFAEGLAAAHEPGVVHRDLKPGNLFVTPSGLLKILDFGLAKLLRPELGHNITQSLTTDTITISGTVPYMAPEQLRGERIDARSDIYSAGAVLYEMAAGRRPFPQTQGPQLMAAILHQVPPPPSSLNPQVMPFLDAIVLKALEKEPVHRYRSARELLVALEALGAGQALPVARIRWPVIARATAVLAGVLLMGLFLGLNVAGLRDRLLRRAVPTDNASLPSEPVRARRSVAVLGFKNLSGRPDEAWLSTALSEMLTTELAAGEQLHTIPGETVAQMKINLSLPDADSFGRETLNRIRQNLGAGNVVLGSYLVMGQGADRKIRVDLRLQDAVAGETLATVTQSGGEAEVSDLVARLGGELRQKLRAGEVPPSDVALVKASLPSNRAARLYSEGLARSHVYDYVAARELLTEATALDPNFALAHSALAAAWAALGYEEKARNEARKAYELSANLPREERLSVEGHYRESIKDWDKAIEVYKALVRFFPDDVEYGLRLAKTRILAAKPKEALATVAELRKLSPPASDDPRIDAMEANALESLGDFKQDLAVAAKAVQKARAAGARLLTANGLYLEAWAYHNLGQPQAAMAAAEEAIQIYGDVGDRHGLANILSVQGSILSNRGDLAGAEKLFDRVMAIDREVGDRRGQVATLNNKATLAYQRADFAGAEALWQQASKIAREIDDTAAAAKLLGNMASVVEEQGDFAGSRKIHEQVLAIFRGIGDQSGIASELGNIGSTLIEEGDLIEGERVSEESRALCRKLGDKNGEVVALLNEAQASISLGNLADATNRSQQALDAAQALGDKRFISYARLLQGQIAQMQGNLSEARKRYEESLALRKETKEKGAEAETRLALAELSLEEGHPADAEKPIRDAREEFRREKQATDEIAADTLLTRALLLKGIISDAENEVAAAGSLASKSHSRDGRLNFTISAARADAARGNPIQARKNLDMALAEAAKYSFVPRQFEARLALGEIEMKWGQSAAGRARLAALEKDATAKGFLLLARKAAAAAK